MIDTSDEEARYESAVQWIPITFIYLFHVFFFFCLATNRWAFCRVLSTLIIIAWMMRDVAGLPTNKPRAANYATRLKINLVLPAPLPPPRMPP
jgi:hypothetical protein